MTFDRRRRTMMALARALHVFNVDTTLLDDVGLVWFVKAPMRAPRTLIATSAGLRVVSPGGSYETFPYESAQSMACHLEELLLMGGAV